MAAAVEGSAITSQQQLAILNAEAQDLSTQVKEAYQDLRAVLSDDDKAICKQRVNNLEARLKDLDEMRKAVTLQLTGQVQPPVPGGGVTEVLQAINELRVTNRHELDIVKKQLQQQQFLMTKTATYSMLGVITALYPQPSQLSGGRDRRFREKLINYYKSNKQGGLMLCTVLGQYVESDAIVAGHLFPTRRAVLAEQFGIRQQDVNNARNGLLWCQCIEYAFELMKVTIAPGPLPGQFTFHVVDDALRNTPLCQHAGECKGSSYMQALEGKTYRDLDGTLLTFPSECPADHRPMERAVLAHFMVSVSLHRGTDSILPAGLQAVVQNCKVHSPMAQQAATLSWLQATCSVQPDTSVESAEAVWHSAPVPLGVGAEGEPDLTWSETEDEE